MASSISIPSFSFVTAIPSSTSATRSSSSLSFSQSFASGTSQLRPRFNSRTRAKFDKFEGELPQDSLEETPSESPQQQTVLDDVEEDDSCLPPDLEGAVRQSSEAAATFVSSGGLRAIVELLIPQLQFLDDEGAQAELWELSRVFVDTLIEETGCQRVKAVYPDAGAAALLKYRWQDAAFGFSSLSDRKPVEKEDEIVVMVVPDYQMLEYVERIASNLSDDPPRPLIMWNPRLISEDVGVGFNVRNLRRFFLSATKCKFMALFCNYQRRGLRLAKRYTRSTFTTVYSMRPLEAGAVFRCYPGLWKVFYDDKERPNRYLLAKELISRPDAEDLEIIFGTVKEESDDSPSLFSKAAGIFSSINRFMKAIS